MKNAQSPSQNTPYWNTGISAICDCRYIETCCPPDICAVTVRLMGMICAYKPWFGPETICPHTSVGVAVAWTAVELLQLTTVPPDVFPVTFTKYPPVGK